MVQIIGSVMNLAAIEGAVGTTATTVRSHRTYTHTHHHHSSLARFRNLLVC